MSTIRKTISISKKDEKLQQIIKDVPSYEVSHVIRQLMYDGLKYRALVEKGLVNDFEVQISVPVEKKEQKKPQYNEKNVVEKPKNEPESFDFDDEIDINSVKLEEIDEKEEDLEDILLNNS